MTRERQCPRCGGSRDVQARRCPSCGLLAVQRHPDYLASYASDQLLALQHSLALAAPVRIDASSYRHIGVDYSRAPDRSAHLFAGRQVGKTERDRQRMRAALAAGGRVFAMEGGRVVEVRAGPQGQLLSDPASKVDGRNGTITLDEWGDQ